MPSEKSLRSATRKYHRNRPIKSNTKTQIAQAESEIKSGNIEGAEKSVNVALETLDKTAQKGIIHKNNASRRKSRLMKKLNFIKTKKAS